MRALIRGVRPMSVMTWAELAALPRPGDILVIEGDGEGRSYQVTSVQFDLLSRDGAGPFPPGGRSLVGTGIVVHVVPEGTARHYGEPLRAGYEERWS